MSDNNIVVPLRKNCKYTFIINPNLFMANAEFNIDNDRKVTITEVADVDKAVRVIEIPNSDSFSLHDSGNIRLALMLSLINWVAMLWIINEVF